MPASWWLAFINIIAANGGNADMETPKILSSEAEQLSSGCERQTCMVQEDFADLVRRGIAGDRTVLPALRAFLDHTPAIWEHVQSLATQVERSWLRVIAGDDLVTQEILTRQAALMKAQLSGPAPTPLEQLLVDRIVVCWLQVQQAELRAAGRLQQHSPVLSPLEEQRLEAVQRRLLMAVKNLAQVRKLLQPGTAIQVNIANQQVNMA
jgi:hypothetical protein